MQITIVTTSQKALKDGKIVGGAPVVAMRQAKALVEHGADVTILDLNKGSVEKYVQWNIDQAPIKVITYEGNFNVNDPYNDEVIKVAKNALKLANGDWILIQETFGGSVIEAANELGKKVIWQPNDYSFLCMRSWFLKGDGTRCDMHPEPSKCRNCQVKGRSTKETIALNFFAIAERFGVKNIPNISTQKTNAWNRAKNVPRFLSACNLFIAQSNKMLEALLAQGVDREKILYVNYGVQPSGENYKQKEIEATIEFAYIARPTYEKGLHLLLEAWSNLSNDVLENSRLTLYSPISQAPSFQRKRIENLLKKCKNVSISNVAVSPILDQIYEKIDVAIQPSLWVDHNTQTILEALCRGVPVIVPKHTSFYPDIVKHGYNGLLIDTKDSTSLLNAITLLAENKTLLSTLKSGQAYKFTDFSWASIVLNWLYTKNTSLKSN